MKENRFNSRSLYRNNFDVTLVALRGLLKADTTIDYPRHF